MMPWRWPASLIRLEGLLVGISAGANVFAARQCGAASLGSGHTVVTILPDTGERYLSTFQMMR